MRQALHLVLLLQQRTTRDIEAGGGFAASIGDPFDAACSDVVGACLSSLETASRAVSAAGIRFFISPSQGDAAATASNVEVQTLNPKPSAFLPFGCWVTPHQFSIGFRVCGLGFRVLGSLVSRCL